MSLRGKTTEPLGARRLHPLSTALVVGTLVAATLVMDCGGALGHTGMATFALIMRVSLLVGGTVGVVIAAILSLARRRVGAWEKGLFVESIAMIAATISLTLLLFAIYP